MKSVPRAGGVPCARHQLVHHPFEAVAFAEEVGFRWWPSHRPERVRRRRSDLTSRRRCRSGCAHSRLADSPALLEEFLVGEEHTDSVTVNGQTVWASIADYIPHHWKSCAIRGSSGW